jgi:hypothetical protein
MFAEQMQRRVLESALKDVELAGNKFEPRARARSSRERSPGDQETRLLAEGEEDMIVVRISRVW